MFFPTRCSLFEGYHLYKTASGLLIGFFEYSYFNPKNETLRSFNCLAAFDHTAHLRWLVSDVPRPRCLRKVGEDIIALVSDTQVIEYHVQSGECLWSVHIPFSQPLYVGTPTPSIIDFVGVASSNLTVYRVDPAAQMLHSLRLSIANVSQPSLLLTNGTVYDASATTALILLSPISIVVDLHNNVVHTLNYTLVGATYDGDCFVATTAESQLLLIDLQGNILDTRSFKGTPLGITSLHRTIYLLAADYPTRTLLLHVYEHSNTSLIHRTSRNVTQDYNRLCPRFPIYSILPLEWIERDHLYYDRPLLLTARAPPVLVVKIPWDNGELYGRHLLLYKLPNLTPLTYFRVYESHRAPPPLFIGSQFGKLGGQCLYITATNEIWNSTCYGITHVGYAQQDGVHLYILHYDPASETPILSIMHKP